MRWVRSGKILKTFFLLFFLQVSLFAGELDVLKKIFPSVENLEGGSDKWLTTAFEIKKSKDYFLLKRIYSYFGDKETEILKIKRKKEFKVEVDLYFAKDFLIADRIFSKLSKRKSDFKRKIKLGDKGIIFGEKGKNGGFNAVYTVLFKLNNFVVVISGDDGFAVMDFTDFVKNEINRFIMDNIEHYLLSTLKLVIKKTGYETKEKEINISDVLKSNFIIKGNVYGYRNKPIEGALVTVKGLGISKYTDKKGYFEIKFDISEGDYKEKKIKIFLKKMEHKKEFMPEIFYLKFKNNKIYKEMYVNSALKKAFVRKNDEFKELNIFDFKMKGNRCEFFLNCSRGAFFRCRQRVVFYTDGHMVFGKWEGTGGSGKIEGIKLIKTKTEKLPLGDVCQVKIIKGDLNGNIVGGNEEGRIFSEDKAVFMAYVNCSDGRDKYFLASKRALLRFDKPVKKYRIGVFKANVSENGYDLYDEVENCESGKYTLDCPVEAPLVFMNFKKEPLKIDVNNSFLFKTYFVPDLNVQQGKITAKFVNSDRDIVSMRNRIVRDGKKDLAIEVDIRGIKGVLSKIEVVSEGVSEVKWDTDSSTVFPAVAVFEKRKFLNGNDGGVRINLDGNNRRFVLYIANSSLVNKRNCKVILYIDGKAFKVGVKNGDG